MEAPKLRIKKRQTLADQLYGQILEQIVSNVLKQGERLPSEKLEPNMIRLLSSSVRSPS